MTPPQAYLRLLGVAFTVEHCASPLNSPTGMPLLLHSALSLTEPAHPLGALPALAFDDEPAPADQLACGELGSAPARAAIAHAAANVADLDAPLSPADRAEAAAFRALVEERLAPATVRFASAPPAVVCYVRSRES